MAIPITIVGLGPGRWVELTLEARDVLVEAAEEQQAVYFRTLVHPVTEEIRQHLPGLCIESFDRFYEESENWETLYTKLAEEVCTLAMRGSVIYAVPGDPLIGEASVLQVLRVARERGLKARIVSGLSFLEAACNALEIDPLEASMQLIDATQLAALSSEELAGKLIPTTPLLVAQLYNRRLASAVKLALSEFYPDEWPLRLVRAGRGAGGTGEAVVELPLYELDRRNYPDQFSVLYVPPVGELTALRVPETLRYITMRLRREPDGCPWDRQQTHETLIRYVIEETYEVVEAIEEGDMEKLADELGDLLLQVYLHAELARQEETFAIGDVLEHINAKLIRRHPHVFGSVEVSSAQQVNQNWEAIKRQERIAAGKDVQAESALEGARRAAPALIVAQDMQKRAVHAGFEFPTLDDAFNKLAEEIDELKEASTPEHRLEELGDVLWMVARIAGKLDINAEEALRFATRKFRLRFQSMEQLARAQGKKLSDYTRPELRVLWSEAKRLSTGLHETA
ncbi:MAG TPA: nucleoside triphosphate pyrophosphohydrolase [Ktedonobacteraceae bacterium]|nr:nucleoside triphosphate pyrophosphohydrolase [Ktedonobacteraceae bacterium]